MVEVMIIYFVEEKPTRLTFLNQKNNYPSPLHFSQREGLKNKRAKFSNHSKLRAFLHSMVPTISSNLRIIHSFPLDFTQLSVPICAELTQNCWCVSQPNVYGICFLYQEFVGYTCLRLKHKSKLMFKTLKKNHQSRSIKF